MIAMSPLYKVSFNTTKPIECSKYRRWFCAGRSTGAGDPVLRTPHIVPMFGVTRIGAAHPRAARAMTGGEVSPAVSNEFCVASGHC